MRQLSGFTILVFTWWKRNRIFYGFLAAAGLLVGVAAITSLFGQRVQERIVVDMGFASVELICWIAVIFISSTTLIKTTEDKSIYFYLSKPVSRSRFLLGFYGGLWGVTLVFFLLLVCALIFLLLYFAVPIDFPILVEIYYLFLKICVILSVGYLFSSYSTSMISSILLTFSAVLVGHLTNGIDYYIALKSPARVMELVYRIIQIVFPYMDFYSVADYLRESGGIDIGMHTVGVTLYSVGYILFLFGITVLIFNRRDL